LFITGEVSEQIPAIAKENNIALFQQGIMQLSVMVCRLYANI
jgi:hypothetical protein